MNKSERIFIRVTHEEKKRISAAASKNGLTLSTYLLKLADQELIPKSHEQLIQNTLKESRFYNGLLSNPLIESKVKKTLSEELRKYV